MAESKIEWTDRSDWNPIRGCTRVSPGCGQGGEGGCYAEAIAGRFSGPGQPFEGFATRTAKGARWTGKVAVMWDRLDLPIRWRKPAHIFASSTSDFFHKDFALEEIATLFGVMIAAHHLRGHTLQVLTKRADIMRERMNDPVFWEVANAGAESLVMEHADPLDRRSDDARATLQDYGPGNPPPGIWLGVSVEDQPRADERIPDLLATPAAVRWISGEPLLGPVDLTALTLTTCTDKFDALEGMTWANQHQRYGGGRLYSGGSQRAKLDWVVAGGESGPGAHPMHPDWARSLRDQCAAAGVPFLFKQWGEWAASGEHNRETIIGGEQRAYHPKHETRWVENTPGPGRTLIARVGKKAAGRLLDGVQHDAFPPPTSAETRP